MCDFYLRFSSALSHLQVIRWHPDFWALLLSAWCRALSTPLDTSPRSRLSVCKSFQKLFKICFFKFSFFTYRLFLPRQVKLVTKSVPSNRSFWYGVANSRRPPTSLTSFRKWTRIKLAEIGGLLTCLFFKIGAIRWKGPAIISELKSTWSSPA